MDKCKICGKHKSEDKLASRCNTFDFDLKLHEDDGDLARIMYHLTQDIVASKNFSDENINRICEKHLRESSLSSNNLLLQTIEELKIKLNVRNRPSDICGNASKVRNKSDLLIYSQRDNQIMVDKCISAQSLLDTSKIVSPDEKLSSISSITTFDYSTSNESEPLQPAVAKEDAVTSNVEFGSNPGRSMDSSVDALIRTVLASKKRNCS